MTKKTVVREIKGGIYLVIDPSSGIRQVVPKLKKAIDGGIDILQVWNNWSKGQDKHAFIDTVCKTAHDQNIPVLVNEEWELLKDTALDGVHFDVLPVNISEIREILERQAIYGLTCGNDLARIKWAVKNRFDYISFCSMFPSPSAGVCEIVSKETVTQARQLTSMPIFLAGGITLDNVQELSGTGMNGIALISAIMKSDDPLQTTKSFKQKLITFQKNNHEAITDR